jgi:hypothetical protein
MFCNSCEWELLNADANLSAAVGCENIQIISRLIRELTLILAWFKCSASGYNFSSLNQFRCTMACQILFVYTNQRTQGTRALVCLQLHCACILCMLVIG